VKRSRIPESTQRGFKEGRTLATRAGSNLKEKATPFESLPRKKKFEEKKKDLKERTTKLVVAGVPGGGDRKHKTGSRKKMASLGGLSTCYVTRA